MSRESEREGEGEGGGGGERKGYEKLFFNMDYCDVFFRIYIY